MIKKRNDCLLIQRQKMQDLVESYEPNSVHIGCLGSHSALEIAYGAKKEGFKTVVVCQSGREKTYTKYYANLFDEVIILSKFQSLASHDPIKRLQLINTIFIPNRSFSTYLGYQKIEEEFILPLFGNRQLLRAEERGSPNDQYTLLKLAGLPTPRIFLSPDEIDTLAMVKMPQAIKRHERGFFVVSGPEDFKIKAKRLIDSGYIRKEDLSMVSIEEFVIGALANLNYFYAPTTGNVEFMGADQRVETDIEGVVQLPARHQALVTREPSLIPIGHRGITLRESVLEQVFDLGEKFVEAVRKHCSPGIIGPFSLQGSFDRDTQFKTFDVSLRMPGSPILQTTSPYTEYKFGHSIGLGQRVAIEIRTALGKGMIRECVT